MAWTIYSNENEAHSKSIINIKHFKLSFIIVLWNILDEMFKISSNIEKFFWKSPLKLSHKTETKAYETGKLEMRHNAEKVVYLLFKYNS